MLNTKLILIEGMPGAGKSTTARHLGSALRDHGVACQWYLEEDDPHPIACLDIPLKELEQKLPPLWRTFTEQALNAPGVTIIESRLWQNTLLFMTMSDYPVKDILQIQQHVGQVIAPLSPVLVYLHQEDVEAALRRHYALRGEALVDADIEMTSAYPWFQSRGLNDLNGWVLFFQEWQGVAEQMYDAWPHHKVKVSNAHEEWAAAYDQMGQFLQLESNP